MASRETRCMVREKWCEPHDRRHRGFTLTELLVVIAVIAILASMLLPALGRGKLMANIASCTANLRSQHQGLMLYTNDNRDHLPTHFGKSQADGGVQWSSTWWMWKLVNTYNVSPATFVCRANPHKPDYDNTAGWVLGLGKNDNWKLCQYGAQWYSMNGRLLQSTISWVSKPGPDGMLARMKTPSRSILLMEYVGTVFVDGVSDLGTRCTTALGTNPNYLRDHRGIGMTFTMLGGNTKTLPYLSNPDQLYFNDRPELIQAGNWYFRPLW